MAGEKNNLAPILSDKNILTKNPSPLPPPPEYQMDHALWFKEGGGPRLGRIL